MMSDDDKRLLVVWCPKWMDTINLTESPLLAKLKARGVITPMQEGVIRSKSGNENQVEKLVGTLRQGDEYTVDYLIYALRESGYDGLTKKLRQPRIEDKGFSEVDGGQASAATASGTSSASPPLNIKVSNTPLAVDVKPCNNDFYEKHRHEAYNMDTKLGNALIICLKKFDDPGLSELGGADVDQLNLSQLCQQFGLDVTVWTDKHRLTAQQRIEDKVKQFAGSLDEDVECLVFVISSHGKSGDEVFGTDGKTVSVMKLLNYFRECPALKGKPKLFLVDACRGNLSLDLSPKKPEELDEIIGFATEEGFVSMQCSNTGSWFITAVVNIFMKMACEKDVQAMLNEVTRSSGLVFGSLQQRPVILPKLRKKWFFFPGL